MLFAAERMRRRAPQTDTDDDTRIARQIGWSQTVGVGFAQSLGLIPGFSRSGAAMSGGLFFGLSHKDAARFAFLLATPIIGAAGVLKLPELFGSTGDGVRGQALVGAIAAGITTWFAVKFLLRFFRSNRLTPFGIYCLVVGIVLAIAFAV